MNTPSATPDFAPTTPRVWQIKLLRDRVPGLLADVDAWRHETGQHLTFRGVLCGHYAHLYLSMDSAAIPDELSARLFRAIPNHQGSIAPTGVWLIQLEVCPVLDEAELWQQCEVA